MGIEDRGSDMSLLDELTRKSSQLRRERLDVFDTACHEAPVEAEAECVKLQMVALWTQCCQMTRTPLNFGRGLQIGDFCEDKGGRKSGKTGTVIRLYRVNKVWDWHKLDRDTISPICDC
jgi:hypothetical protein